MSIRNKIGLGMIALFILATIIGNFLDGFWHGVAFIIVVAWSCLYHCCGMDCDSAGTIEF